MAIPIQEKKDISNLEHAEPGSIFFYKQGYVHPGFGSDDYDAGVVVAANTSEWMKKLLSLGFAGAIKRVYRSQLMVDIRSAMDDSDRRTQQYWDSDNHISASVFPECDWKPKTKELIVATMPVPEDFRLARRFAEGLELLLAGRM